ACLLPRFEGRVERAKASVTGVVKRAPRVVRLDAVAQAHAPGHRLMDVRERAGCYSREERGSVRRAFLDGGQLERKVQHGGDDLEPEPAPCPAPRDPARLGPHAELAEELHRVPETVRDALEHRPRDRASTGRTAEGRQGGA